MRRSLFSLALAALLAAGAFAAPATAQQNSITVFAAASLTEAWNAMAPAFTKKSGIAVTFNYGGSDTLATQIKQGAPVDVFASANLVQMKVVSDAGLVGGTPKTFAKNRLVLISPKSGTLKFAGPADLARPGTKVVLAAATVPVGGYARATFGKLSGTGSYPADFPAAVEKNVVSNELDVKAVVTKIALGEGDAGVVYSTDVTPSVADKLNVLPFPSSVAPDIEYPIATLKNAPNPKGAQAFVDYVLSPEGQSYLKARGFISP
ncbi:MAG: molybdate ABC transporter substrate-binding protein [Candidatus Lustribacter sp.]|jgi:molybdate transport system substrate-binding protein